MNSRPKTAFVFAGGGSLGAVEVGMLKVLVARGFEADFVVGSSVGAINAAYFAGNPTREGVAHLEGIWRGLRRSDVFPFTLLDSLMALVARRDYLVEPTALSQLLERDLPYQRLEEAKLPCHIVATDLLEGVEMHLSSGPAVQALLASAAIPGVFPPVLIDGHYLVDGGVTNHTPIAAAVALGASRLIVLPTGYSCALEAPPKGAIAAALQGLNILIARQLINEVQHFATQVEISVVPPLCPVATSPYDFQATGELIDRAAQSTEQWLEKGVELIEGVPHQLPPHTHRAVGDPYAAQSI